MADEIQTTPRYEVRRGSQSAHCCFEATVVDATKPDIIGGEQYEDHCYEICECFSREDAKKIAKALNLLLQNERTTGITPEMLEAGVQAWWSEMLNPQATEQIEDHIIRIYTAMEAARAKAT